METCERTMLNEKVKVKMTVNGVEGDERRKHALFGAPAPGIKLGYIFLSSELQSKERNSHKSKEVKEVRTAL